MEHSCHKCGHSVEDGIPFCAQCGAPQIRVIMPEPAAPLAASNAATISTATADIPQVPPAIHLALRRAQALQPCAAAALLAVVAMFLGLAIPAAALGAGFLAVAFYRYRNPGVVIRAGLGARLGAVSGLICFLFSGIFIGIAALVVDVRAKFREQMIEAIQKAASRSNDPQVQAMMESLKTPEGLALMMIFAIVAIFLLFLLMGGIGGALGGAILSRRDRG